MPTLRNLIAQEDWGFIFRLAQNALVYGWYKYVLGKKTAVREVRGSRMKLRLTDPGISRTLFLICDREREHWYLLQKILAPGQTVLDLGANIGFYVLLENKILKGSGRILAVEPHPDNFELLKDNIAINQLPNSTTIHAAVTKTGGTAKLHVSKLANVHSLHQHERHATGEVMTVPAVTLSSLMEDYGGIDVMRMDIEGYEQDILDDVICLSTENDTFSPAILFELHGRYYDMDRFLQTLSLLYDNGFRATYVATSNKEKLTALGVPIETSIKTDGRVRHVGRDVTLEQLNELIVDGRCLVLEKR